MVVVVVLHCLRTPSQVSVMLHCLTVLKAIIIGLSNTWRMRTMWNANLSWIGICWNLLRTLMWKIFDILMWWKMNSSRYRVLSQIAHDVLAIFVSTVAFESAFSSGGVFCIRFVVHYLLIQLKLLFVPRIG